MPLSSSASGIFGVITVARFSSSVATYFMPAASRSSAPLDDFIRLTRDLYVAPGVTGFWQGTFRDPRAPAFAAARELFAAGNRVRLEILYSDQDGGQRTITQFALLPREDGGWLAAETRHWNLDRPNPRA